MPLNAVRHELLDKQFRSLFSLHSTFCLELFPRALTFLVSHYVLLLRRISEYILGYFQFFSLQHQPAHWIISYEIKMSWFNIWKRMNEWKCERQEIVHEIEMEMFRPNVSSFGIFFSAFTFSAFSYIFFLCSVAVVVVVAASLPLAYPAAKVYATRVHGKEERKEKRITRKRQKDREKKRKTFPFIYNSSLVLYVVPRRNF